MGSCDILTIASQGGVDYTLASTVVTFASGAASGSQNVNVAINNDKIVEGNEAVALGIGTLVDPTGRVSLGATTTHTMTITDNDTATLAIEATRTLTEQGGAQTVIVTLTTSDGAGGTATLAGPLSASVTQLGGTATSGSDYTAFGTQTVTFAGNSGNSATQTVTLTMLNDTLVEGNEIVALQLGNLSATLNGQASLGNTSHTATITDNDTATIKFVALTSNAPEGTTPHLVGVQLVTTGNGVTGAGSLAQGTTVSVNDLGGGSATAGGVDYTFATQFVTFSAGDTGSTKTVSAAIVNDKFPKETRRSGSGFRRRSCPRRWWSCR